MRREHRDCRPCRHPALAVTRSQNSRPADGLPDAVFAHRTTAIKNGARADQPVIVKRLHCWNTGPPSDIVSGRGYLRERIMEMDHVWTHFRNLLPQLITCCSAPNCIDTHL